MLSAGHQEGFSIIELSVALTVVAVLLTLGVPSLSGYIQNARLGAAAKSFYTGLQIARAEAVKRNAEVEFVMTDTAVASGIENALVADAQGRNWVVRARASAINAASPATSTAEVRYQLSPTSAVGRNG